MIEKWKESVDNGGVFGALVRSRAYSFDLKSMRLIQQYLSNRKQRVKVDNAYSSWK